MIINLRSLYPRKSLNESKNVKALRADYDKALKKEQALSSLLLINLEKYKAAKTKGDEKAIAKFTKIASQLSKKKKAATDKANQAYQAYEDKISGLHSDAELELKEGILTEVKPFVDPKLKSKPTDQVQYIATNDHRYPSEIAFFDTKKNEVVFFNIQQKEVERVSVDRLNSTHWVRDYMPGLKYNQGLRTGAMEGKLTEGKYDHMVGKAFKLNVQPKKEYQIQSIEDNRFVHAIDNRQNKSMFDIRKVVKDNPGIDKKPKVKRSAWNKGTGDKNLISKREYAKILMGAMKDATSMGDQEATHDMAQSMIYDQGILARLVKDHPGKNSKQLTQQLQWDLEAAA